MNKINQFILAEGNAVRREIEGKKQARKKTVYVNLKDGQSLRGFLLASEFIMYMCHNDFKKGIKSHVCKNPRNEADKVCLSCLHGVKRTKKTIVAFFNVDTQQIEIFNASNKAMKSIYSFIDQYEEESTTTPIVLSRSGNGLDTTYNLMPTRVKAAEQFLFEKPKDIELDDEFYKNVLFIPSDDQVRKLLKID